MKNTHVLGTTAPRIFMKAGLAILALSAVAGAANLTEADRKEGLAQLERTRAGVVEAASGLSPAQWNFKPGPDRWSVAEVVEHIALTEDMLFESVTANVMQAPAGAPDRDLPSVDQLVITAIADRSQKAQAPTEVTPTGRWTPVEALHHFLNSRKTTVRFLESTNDLRDHVVDSPIGQPMDAYQWLLFISAHSERHTKQIAEVKADPKFPK